MTKTLVPFTDRSALVTGGGSGIGAALGAALCHAGAHVVLTDVDGAALERTRAALDGSRAGGTVRTCLLDVRDRDAFQRVVDDLVDERSAG